MWLLKQYLDSHRHLFGMRVPYGGWTHPDNFGNAVRQRLVDPTTSSKQL